MNKNEMDKDCRALSRDFLDKFMPGKEYSVFIDLVKKYSDELILCFRGNNQPSEAVCIYYNNHLVYKIEASGLVSINFDHARYSKNYREYWRLINFTYGFSETAESKPRVRVTQKNSKKGGTRYYTSIGYVSSMYTDTIGKNVENIYVSCIRKMLIDSFDYNCKTDFFRDTANRYKEYHSKLPQTGVQKSQWLEKVRQQQLFSRIKSLENGYFLYDMEFSQKSIIDSEKYGEALSNEPDMLAIYFDDFGKPVKFAFVEVKCTEHAYNDKNSGMVAHLDKMCNYPKDYLKSRLREAALIMSQYNELDLYNLKKEVVESDYLRLIDEKQDNLFIFTDEAIRLFEKDSNNRIIEFKSKAKRLDNIDIHIPGCKEIEFWVY